MRLEVSKAGDDGRGFGRDEDGFVCVAAFLILLDLGGLGVQLPANQMTMWGRLLGYLTNARGTATHTRRVLHVITPFNFSDAQYPSSS